MKLTGLHFLLTYQCNFECDHCFVWGSPLQTGVMTLERVRNALRQAQDLGSITSIYFEGGEPFLYYPILLRAVQDATDMGFQVGLVSNAYWAISPEDALEWLRPFAGLIQDLSVSSDLYHYSESLSRQSCNAIQAAHSLGIPTGTISIAQPEAAGVVPPSDNSPMNPGVMYRGRRRNQRPASLETLGQFTECPHDDLREPGRIHLDPWQSAHLPGYLHR
jgi:hypothetical protein